VPPPTPPGDPLPTLLALHLSQSGISAAEAARGGIFFNKSPLGLGFTHHELDGTPMLAHGVPYVRTRRFTYDEEQQLVPAEEPRYVQPKGTEPRLYYPMGLGVNWVEVAREPSHKMLVTEGEKKAFAGTKHLEMPCISIGGVNAWTKKGLPISDLDNIMWAGRQVLFAFDADVMHKPEALAALEQFEAELTRRGAQVRAADLSAIGNKLDDALMKLGADPVRKALNTARPLVSPVVLELDARLIHVENMDVVYDEIGGDLITLTVARNKFLDLGTVGRQAAFLRWLSWPRRRKVAKLEMAPGRPLTFERDGVRYLNEWRGWGVAPVKGETRAWRELLSHVCDDNKEAVRWLERWIAWPFQTGDRARTAVMLIGPHGTGKSTLGQAIASLHGHGAWTMGPRSFDADRGRNQWIAGRTFVHLDDSEGETRKQNVGALLKTVITSDRLVVDAKYMPSREVANHVQILACSNHWDEIRMTENDRRWFVAHGTSPLPTHLIEAFQGEGRDTLLAAVMHRLLQLDLSGYDPARVPVTTAAKRIVAEATQTPEEAWLRAHVAGELEEYDALPYTVIRANELWSAWNGYVDRHRLSKGPCTHAQALIAKAREVLGPEHVVQLTSRHFATRRAITFVLMRQAYVTLSRENVVFRRLEEEKIRGAGGPPALG
jgi:hypothetical protein